MLRKSVTETKGIAFRKNLSLQLYISRLIPTNPIKRQVERNKERKRDKERAPSVGLLPQSVSAKVTPFMTFANTSTHLQNVAFWKKVLFLLLVRETDNNSFCFGELASVSQSHEFKVEGYYDQHARANGKKCYRSSSSFQLPTSSGTKIFKKSSKWQVETKKETNVIVISFNDLSFFLSADDYNALNRRFSL